MLTTTNKTTWGLLRKLFVLPVSLVAVGMLSVSTIESKANAFVAPIVSPVVATQQPGLQSPVQEPAISSPAKQPKVFKAVPVQHPVKQATTTDTVPAPAKTNDMPKVFIASNNDEHIILRSDKVLLNLKARDSAAAKTSLPQVIYYINNQLATIDEVSKLDPGQIKSISVWKNEDAIKKFGPTGANGVIEVFTKVIP